MMKRIVATLFFISLVLAAAALLAPNFIDWNRHKDRLVAQLEPYLGRRMQVDGAVGFRLLPSPQIVLEDVSLSNAEGSKADNFIRLGKLEARIRFEPLLQGRVDVETINLAQPEINLEILDDGTNNWTGVLKEREKGTLGGAAEAIQLNRITVTDGVLTYSNQVTGAAWRLERLNLVVGAETLFGPYQVTGDMQYKNAQVGVDIKTGRFGAQPVPFHLALNPVEGLPQVKFDGTMTAAQGLDVQGDLAIAHGNIASLFDSDFLKDIHFLNEEADLAASLEVKGGQAKLGDIKAKIGDKGSLSGTASLIFEKGKKPTLAANLSGAGLKIGGKGGFTPLPAGFDALLTLKGKQIVWNGHYLPAVSISADTDKNDWVVKNLRIDLPGKSVVKMAGVVTPGKQFAAYSIQLETEDLGQMLKSARLSDANALKALQESGVVKKLEFSSSLDLTPKGFSLANIEALIAGAVKMSGVLNIDRGGKRPAFDAKLNFDQADMASFPAEAWQDFAKRLLATDGAVDLSVANYASGDFKVPDFTLKGKFGEQGFTVSDMRGHLAPRGSFTLAGTAGSFYPAAGLDLAYTFEAAETGGVAKALGAEVPPPIDPGAAVNLKGTVKGDAARYAFTAEGAVQESAIVLSGTATSAEGKTAYQSSLRLKGGQGWAQLGLPIDRLLGGGPFELSGDLAGTRTNWRISGVDVGGVTGWVERKNGKPEASLSTDKADFDEWFSQWMVKNDFGLALEAKKLVWRTNEIDSAALRLDAGPAATKVTGLRGRLWNGELTADFEAQLKDKLWSGTLKGGLRNADLGKFAQLMEFDGFAVGRGDLDFDLRSDGEKNEKNWFHGLDGTLKARFDALTVEAFNPAALGDLLSRKDMPADPETAARAALASGAATYNDADASFSMKDGRINIDRLDLADQAAEVAVEGHFDMGPETFAIAADIRLKTPPGLPPVALRRSGEMGNAAGYTLDVAPLARHLSREEETAGPADTDAPPAPSPNSPVPVAEEEAYGPLPERSEDQGDAPADAPIEAEPLDSPVVLPQPETIQPPAQPDAESGAAIKGIMERLDEAPPQPQPEPQAEQRPLPSIEVYPVE